MRNDSIASRLVFLGRILRAAPSVVAHSESKRWISLNSGINRGLRASRDATRAPRQRDQREWQRSQRPDEGATNRGGPEHGGTVRYHPLPARNPGLAPADRDREEDSTWSLWPTSGFAADNHKEQRAGSIYGQQEKVQRDERWQRNTFQSPRANTELDDDDLNIPGMGIPYTTAASTFIFGRRAVISALRANKRRFYKLYLLGRSTRDAAKYSDVIREAKDRGLEHLWKHYSFLNNIKESIEVPGAGPVVDDGVYLEVSALPQPPLQHLGSYSRARGDFNLTLSYQSQEEAEVNGTMDRVQYADSDWRAPCLLWLHGVVDARNVGAVLRSAIYFGIDGVVFSSRATASISDGVLKSSAGAAEHLPIFKVHNADAFIEHSRANGWEFYATVSPDPPTQEYFTADGRQSRREYCRPIMLDRLRQTPLVRNPCVIVLGNEDEGLPPQLIRKMDHTISIASTSSAAKNASVDSLNVSVASAIFCEKFLSKPHHGFERTQRTVPMHEIETDLQQFRRFRTS